MLLPHNYNDTIIDGEYVTKNLNGKPIRLFLAFDLYFSSGKILERILMRSSQDIEEGEYEKSRLEGLRDVINGLDLHKKESEIEFMIEKKIFKFGNVLTGKEDYLQMIEDREEYLINNNEELSEQSRQKLENDIQLAKQSSKIFEESSKILTQIVANQFNYPTDGLIYTPIYKTVGEGERKQEINMVVDGVVYLSGNQ